MGPLSKRRNLILILAALGAVTASCGSRVALAAPRAPRPVVSYLISGASDTNDWAPDEPYLFDVPRHVWHWRIFDPVTGKDTLFLELRSFPLLMQWDSLFTSVEFISGNRIVKVPWRLGGRARTLAPLPADSAFCDFWSDPDRRWHLVTQAMVTPDKGRDPVPVAVRWDQDRLGGWRRAVVDSPGLSESGEGYESPKLQEGATRVRVVTVSSLLDSMRIESHWNARMQHPCAWVSQDHCAWVASARDTSVGIEMWYGYGDTFHAMEPFIWVDRARGRHKMVYAPGQSHDEAGGQLAFAERRGFLLVVAEFSGAYPAVVDMRSGDVVFRTNQSSARAVWVPAPRGLVR